MKETYAVLPGQTQTVSLDDWDPNDTLVNKKTAAKAMHSYLKRMVQLQELLYATGQYALLVVLQGMDTSGKDGTIKKVFPSVNPQGINIVSFKVPTAQELSHDFLWRIHRQTPAKGSITIFNRSQYEDVLVPVVHNLIDGETCESRYHQITQFEDMLVRNNTIILKFFLHISRDEQKKRLMKRLNKPDKHWKLSMADLRERKRWPDYIHAYEMALSACSSEAAPWFIIPANKRWYRNYVIAGIIVETLAALGLKYPEASEDFSNITIED